MSIELVEKFLPYVDEQFATESKKDLLTNQDFDWEGAHSVRIYKITTSKMNDYGRSGPDTGNWSRYGSVDPLSATTERMALRRDRSFTFAIDKLDQDETAQQLEAAKALARQNREVTIPEVDAYTYGVMCANAGYKPEAKALTAAKVYVEILAAFPAHWWKDAWCMTLLCWRIRPKLSTTTASPSPKTPVLRIPARLPKADRMERVGFGLCAPPHR